MRAKHWDPTGNALGGLLFDGAPALLNQLDRLVRALSAHDTLLVFIQGVQNAEVDRPSTDAVLRGIEEISSEGHGPLNGPSGQIDYPRTGSKAIPRNKATMILRAQAHMETERVLLCGRHETADPPPDTCPASLGP